MIIEKSEYLPLSFSSLKAFSVSPLAFIHYKLHRSPPTESMKFGTRLHQAILEPDKFADEVVVYEGRRDKRSKEYQQFLTDNPGADVITPAEMRRIKTAFGRLQYHAAACELLEKCTHFERMLEFTRNGVPHRGIVDAHGDTFALDVKTAQQWDPDGFERTAYQSKYFMQAAMYVHALKQHNVTVDAFYFLVIQSAEPYNVALYVVDAAYLYRGAKVWDRMLIEFEEWDGKTVHRDNAPTYELRAPKWVTPIVDEWAEWLPE